MAAKSSSPVTHTPGSLNLQQWIDELRHQEAVIRTGGGKEAIARQHKKERLTARERLAELIDEGTTLFELGLWAAWGMYQDWGGAPSAGAVTAQTRKTDPLGRTVCTREVAERLFDDCPPGTVDWALAKVRPQHELPVPDDTRWPDVRVAYVYGEQEPAVAPEWIKLACRERLGIEALGMPGGHSLFVSRPAELARTLDSLAPAR